MNKEFWKDKNVFITGHTGFKGSWLSIWLKELTFSATQFDESEDLRIKKIPLKKAVEMCLDGFIIGSLSLIGLLKLARTYSF